MERQNKPALLGLPTECLNRIVELVVHHEQTGGIICPRPDNISDNFYLLISGHRFSMDRDEQPKWPIWPLWLFSPEEVTQWENRQRIWNESPNKASGHTCPLDCLTQPPIVSVNRQLRELSLPMFYGLNQIHLELGNFELSDDSLVP